MRLRFAAAVFAATVLAAAASHAEPGSKPGTFDHLILSLSWSPTWCAEVPGRAQERQCAARSYGFVVHGLWPQNSAPPHPTGCGNAAGVPPEVARSVLPIMPSTRLIDWEWRQHGTCFADDPAAYFATVKSAWEKVSIPPALQAPKNRGSLTGQDIKDAFLKANPGMPAESITVSCKKPGRHARNKGPLSLSDVRICLDKDLKYQACPPVPGDRCAGPLDVPAIK